MFSFITWWKNKPRATNVNLMYSAPMNPFPPYKKGTTEKLNTIFRLGILFWESGEKKKRAEQLMQICLQCINTKVK